MLKGNYVSLTPSLYNSRIIGDSSECQSTSGTYKVEGSNIIWCSPSRDNGEYLCDWDATPSSNGSFFSGFTNYRYAIYYSPKGGTEIISPAEYEEELIDIMCQVKEKNIKSDGQIRKMVANVVSQKQGSNVEHVICSITNDAELESLERILDSSDVDTFVKGYVSMFSGLEFLQSETSREAPKGVEVNRNFEVDSLAIFDSDCVDIDRIINYKTREDVDFSDALAISDFIEKDKLEDEKIRKEFEEQSKSAYDVLKNANLPSAESKNDDVDYTTDYDYFSFYDNFDIDENVEDEKASDINEIKDSNATKDKNNMDTKEIQYIASKDLDYMNTFFHFSRIDNRKSIEENGLQAANGGENKVENCVNNKTIYFSKGISGVLKAVDAWARWEYDRHVNKTDYGINYGYKDYDRELMEYVIYDKLYKDFKNRQYYTVDLIEGKDGDFEYGDIDVKKLSLRDKEGRPYLRPLWEYGPYSDWGTPDNPNNTQEEWNMNTKIGDRVITSDRLRIIETETGRTDALSFILESYDKYRTRVPQKYSDMCEILDNFIEYAKERYKEDKDFEEGALDLGRREINKLEQEKYQKINKISIQTLGKQVVSEMEDTQLEDETAREIEQQVKDLYRTKESQEL